MLQKGTRVQFVGDPKTGAKAKGTVMQQSHTQGGLPHYEVHTDLGTVLHFPEKDAAGNVVLETIEK